MHQSKPNQTSFAPIHASGSGTLGTMSGYNNKFICADVHNGFDVTYA